MQKMREEVETFLLEFCWRKGERKDDGKKEERGIHVFRAVVSEGQTDLGRVRISSTPLS